MDREKQPKLQRGTGMTINREEIMQPQYRYHVVVRIERVDRFDSVELGNTEESIHIAESITEAMQFKSHIREMVNPKFK